ncbi:MULTISPECIES: GIY-YIG nuclease family protein [unclassified Rhodococcus (in: high G+C Gram-positive bacteria)]|uniref:GIY-YIG nuclease family protein n=1 Tax=unclassified Rhodococcus (in: high G+C Gram-positive bacteria) TaxID=192944 RepID=UPI00117A765F|nr:MULTISPECIES: GIY-YIG nuclease family protein [unclassified Rhodococcus (in: high G+C Gram-positive bacteria)]
MSSHGKSSLRSSAVAPRKSTLPADDVQSFRTALREVLGEKDDRGRVWSAAKWGVYAFYDYDGEPIYVGQTKEKLSVRVQRHLTNQRTDAVAMRVLDVFEVAEIEIWPLWQYEDLKKSDGAEQFRAAERDLNAHEYTAYLEAIDKSRHKAILNEKIPPVSEPIALPASLRRSLISEQTRRERGHPDIRIARRAETISRLAAVTRERGEVSEGLRRVLVVQAVRLAYLSAERLAFVEGHPIPDPAAIDVTALVGSVLHERDSDPDTDTESDPDPDAEPEGELDLFGEY